MLIYILIVQLDQDQKQENKKNDIFEGANTLHEGRELTINAFKGGICLLKSIQEQGLKISNVK